MRDLSIDRATRISWTSRYVGMFDRTGQKRKAVGRPRVGDYLLSIAYFGLASGAMMVWMAAIGWGAWRLIEWMMS